jgi:hypothetical protein
MEIITEELGPLIFLSKPKVVGPVEYGMNENSIALT